ncbi:MAG: ABC transporter permease [Candidatus Humimicrobiaceae bacterium]
MVKIISLLFKDFTLARRDNIILYMIIAPILIAVIMALFIPSFESGSLTFAVNSEEDNLVEELESYGNVETFESSGKIRERVSANDDVAGIIKENGSYKVILEGNENSELGETVAIILESILRDGNLAGYRYTVLGDNRSLLKQYTAIFLILMSILMAGMMVGFNIIDEKETGAIKALSISPIKLAHLLLARSIIVLALSLLLSVASSVILLGVSINFWKLIVGVIFSSSLGILLGITVGGIADNQIKGIAVVKVLSLPFTLLPAASIFIPEKYKIFLYPFPNYWMFRIFKNVFIDIDNMGDFWISNIITISITVALMLVVLIALRNKLKFKQQGI